MNEGLETTLELVEASRIENLVCEEVKEEEAKELMPFVEEMIKFCISKGGVGLAAPQVGLNKRIIVWYANDVFNIGFNPEYYPENTKKTNTVEQCMSYPDEEYFLFRNKYIRAVYKSLSPSGKFVTIKKKMSAEDAVVFAHETDHTKGITIKMIGKKL